MEGTARDLLVANIHKSESEWYLSRPNETLTEQQNHEIVMCLL